MRSMAMPAIMNRISQGIADDRDAQHLRNLFAPWLFEKVAGAYDVLMADPMETRQRLSEEQRQALVQVLRGGEPWN